jgi:hypothetical protein
MPPSNRMHSDDNSDKESATTNLKKLSSSAEFINPPNRMKRMSQMPGGKSVAEMSDAAESSVSSMSNEFVEVAKNDISGIRKLVDELANTVGSPKKTSDEIYQIGVELTGLAGTFDYPLITQIGTDLIDFVVEILESGKTLGSDIRYGQIVGLHLNSMEMIISGQIKGSGGSAEMQMVDGLRRAVEKVTG